jgi:GrpB-like predicted nucleotidyltransferase (UPF0157 family)
MRRIEIVDYQPAWREDYARIAQRLRDLGAANIVRIDHIGSTSVEGLAAKDVIDIQVTVTDLSDPEHLHALVGAGFQLRSGIDSDVLVGMDQNSPELRKQYFREPDGERRTHVHVREAGRLNQRYALLFRDYLRAEADARRSYEAIKRRLAEVYPTDIDGYLSIKDPVMDLIYQAAEQWAHVQRWQPDEDYD